MGGAQGKYPEKSQSRGLEKLERENGYVPKEGPVGSRRPTGQRYSAMLCKAEVASVVGRSSSGSSGGGSCGEKKLSDGGGGGSSGGWAERVLQFGEEEVVDGWLKWLIYNLPKEVLACLVPKSAENYDKLDKVGQGTYSNVYKARDRETGKIVALKKVRFDTSEPESIKFMAGEIIILQKLDHPNVVKLEGIATSRLQYSLYLVFDFMQSDLATIVLRGEERLTEPQVKCYMHQLLSGLQHCHEKGILHRDLKGSNLLIDKNGMLKIADFGLANFYYPKNKRPLTSRVVTLWYRAPELLLGSTDYGVGIDLWSAGCILAEMFSGMPIMPGRTEVEQLLRIFKLCGTPSEDYWKKLRLSTTFRPPKSYKPSFFEAFGSFPESSLGLLTTLLALEPAQRGTASSALQNKFFYMSPLACDLSGLPVIWQHDDDSTQTNEKRRHRTSRMKQRCQTHRERRKKDLEKEKPNEESTNSREEQDQKTFELSNRRREPGSSTSSSSSATKLSSQDETPTLLFSPITSKKKVSPRTQGYANGDKKIKKLPPLPSSKTGSSNYINNENMYRLNQVQRSASTREFRKVNQRKHFEMYAVDD